jgi:hypothetical protein
MGLINRWEINILAVIYFLYNSCLLYTLEILCKLGCRPGLPFSFAILCYMNRLDYF